jgi:trimethylamine---corrinoid protein Co-methyltransferase
MEREAGDAVMVELTRRDCENIHRGVMRILAEVGVNVEHPKLLEVLEASGATVDAKLQRAFFPPAVVEDFLAACPKEDWSRRRPRLAVRTSLYQGPYLDARSGEYLPLSPDRVKEYLTVAKALPEVDSSFITGAPWVAPPELEPLYERLYCWKWGAEPSAVLYPYESSQHLLDLYQAYAELKGASVKDVFRGGVFMMSPLRLSAEEARQFVWWWERGFDVGISHMTTQGLTGPVTIAGVAAVNIAEEIALAILRKACYGERKLFFFTMVAPVDMRTLLRPYGRPEMPVANLAVIAMARHYGVGVFAQSGVADGMAPSNEVGAQKALSTLSALMAGGDAMVDAGFCSGDIVHSPLQMILDADLAGALRRMMEPVDTSDEAIGVDAIAEVGPGGVMTGTMHTAEYHRRELWEPRVWGREPFSTWNASGRKLDVDRARDVFEEIMAAPPEVEELTPEEERELRKVIERRATGPSASGCEESFAATRRRPAYTERRRGCD